MDITIKVPLIKSDDGGFDAIFKIAHFVTSNPINYYNFDFTHCSKISHNGIVMLGGLARYIASQSIKGTELLEKQIPRFGTNFLVGTMSTIVSDSLLGNNFLSYFHPIGTSYSPYNQGEYIGYREHTNILDETSLTEHLINEWLSNDKLSLSRTLKAEIISRIIEIFMNAYGHGVSRQPNTKLGVYSCGEYDRKTKKLHISVLDFGIGIVGNVMKNCPEIKTEEQAMRWALTLGNSTNTDSLSPTLARGLGFELLRKFVKVNKGELRIYSNSVKAYVDHNGLFDISKNVHPFPGTLVSITINCDGRKYMFASEKNNLHSFF
ncbi:hypothetical protein [Acinetobacter pittii]|uniref:hypothetical protein n=1 Tax=Acinetobacter pittii TaxID=48296 RepID=UPI00237FEE6B|nr:hypothetical protein [Acinetobacter pittii]MDE4038335.1 hypothetical protein [Acinetobacter pittii]WPP88998.1 hypothetical protein SOI77_02930 [Acinetobacter pittii]